jgi:hypothetical protein
MLRSNQLSYITGKRFDLNKLVEIILTAIAKPKIIHIIEGLFDHNEVAVSK